MSRTETETETESETETELETATMLSQPQLVAVLIVAVVVTGTANNFAGRIRAETLQEYDGTVASIVDAMVFFVFYGTGLAVQLRHEHVRSQIRYLFSSNRWRLLVLAGFSDQCGTLCGFTAQPYLTALMYSLMNQAIILFMVMWSLLLLKTRYIALEAASVVAVLCAAVGCVFAAGGAGGENSPSMAILTATSTIFPAAAYVLKELVFAAYGKESKGHDNLVAQEEGATSAKPQLSVFVVQFTVGVIGLLAAVPLALVGAALSSQDASTALAKGFDCLFHCDHAATAYVVYSIVNTTFNLAIILLVSNGSALLTFLAMKAVVPCTALLSPLPWPLIGAKSVPPIQWLLLCFILLAIAGFRMGTIQREKLSQPGCCWPFCRRVDADTHSRGYADGSAHGGRMEVPTIG